MEHTQQNQKTRFYFTLEKDIILLKEVLNCNPYQLGGEKWVNVVKNLKVEHQWEISQRTAKERVAHLLAKSKKEDLTSRSGTEEQITERKQLLCEIESFKEETISEFAGGGSNTNSNLRKEVEEANKERDEIIEQNYGRDTPISSNTKMMASTRKRKAVSTEEEILLKKQMLDYQLEEKKLQFQHEEKMAQLEVEKEKNLGEKEFRMKNLEIEKRRLEIEQANKELLNTVLSTMKTIFQNMNKNS